VLLKVEALNTNLAVIQLKKATSWIRVRSLITNQKINKKCFALKKQKIAFKNLMRMVLIRLGTLT